MTFRGYVDTQAGQVHFRASTPADHGGDMANASPFVLLHQSPLSSRTYEAALPLLGQGAGAYALDTPGHGGSDPAPHGWEVDDYADAFWSVIDGLGLGHVRVLGRATGSVFAVAMALQQPERVSALVLHGLPVYTSAEREDRLAGFAPPWTPTDSGDHLRWIWNRIRGEYPWASADMVTTFAHDYLSSGPDFAVAYRAMWHYDMASALGRLGVVPALLSGDRDRIGFMQERARQLLPHAPATTLEGATDFVATCEPERFATAVESLVAAGGRCVR